MIFLFVVKNYAQINRIEDSIDSTRWIETQYRRGVELQNNYQSYNDKYRGKDLYEEKRKHYPIDFSGDTNDLKKAQNSTGVWTELNPKVPRVDYYDIYFKDRLSGFAVGEFGAIIKTTDGGYTWTNKSYQTEKTLLRIHGSDSFVVIVGTGGTILRSTDFGESWYSVSVEANTNIWGVYTFNDSLCFVCTIDGRLIKTTDAGNTWRVDSIEHQLSYWDLQFMDSDTGFISCSNGKILKTTDAGNSWDIKETGDLYDLFTIAMLPDGNIITAGSSGQIYYSTDFGETFSQAGVPINFIIEDIAFVNNNLGIAIGQATVTNAILKTTDGGLNWKLVKQKMGHLKVDFISDSVGYNVGIDLKIYKSTDQGENWEEVIIGENLTSVSIPNDSISYFLGWYNLYKYSSNQLSKVKLLNSGSSGIINFLTDSIGFLVNTNRDIYKTFNGGIDWIKIDSNLSVSQVVGIQFISANIGWYLAKTYLKKTTDGGKTWLQIYNGSDFNNLFFLDSLNGWIIGNNKTYRTHDGGTNWNIINTSYSFYDIAFANTNTGYAASGQLYKTTNGGNTWELINDVNGYKLELIDSSMLVTVDNQGIIFMSWDKGITWTKYKISNGRSLKFSDKNRGYFVGDVGLIYEYSDSIVVTVEMDDFNMNVDDVKFKLYPNFPNPFNAQTIINFNLPYDSEVRLKIFNILGEKVDEIIFNELKAGLNSFKYSADNLNSGLYIYIISTPHIQLLGKMMLIK